MAVRHGGDVYRKKIWMDYSVNINPLGIDEEVKSAINKSIVDCEKYPDIDCGELREKIAVILSCRPNQIICGNGASELFVAIVHTVVPSKILIPVPSFYGYERAALAAHADVVYYEMTEADGFCLNEQFCDALQDDIDLVFLANPNNPVGNRIPDDLLYRILKGCGEKDIKVVLDECFVEFVQGARSAVQWLKEFPNMILVRAFTKIYAIPGIRLGYLVCSDEKLCDEIRLQLPEWNVSVAAQAAGIAACERKEYRQRTPEYVAAERAYLKDALEKNLPDVDILESETNYLLFKTGFDLYDMLLNYKVLIRDCSNYRGLGKGYYRIAVKKHEDNLAFVRVLKTALEESGRNEQKD